MFGDANPALEQSDVPGRGLRSVQTLCVCLPASLHHVLVYGSVSEDFFVEELIGEEDQ